MRTWTDERRQKMSERMRGENNPFFGKTHDSLLKECWSNDRKGTKHTAETKQKMSNAIKNYYKEHPETKELISRQWKGRKWSKEQRQTLSLQKIGIKNPMYGNVKEKNPNWKGGLTSASKLIRNSKEYGLWRTAVFERDEYTCQFCSVRGGKLQVDHIKPFALFPELRFAIDNGRTLCIPCHKTTDTYGSKTRQKN